MIHERVDIERWKGLFPLAELRSKAREKALAQSREQPQDPWDELTVIPEPPRLDVLPGQLLPPVDVDIRAETAHEVSEDDPELPEADEELVTLLGPGGEAITSPYDMAVVESLREEVFVGGLPYRPASQPWPLSGTGKPLTFMAQLCFADSLDLTGALPGDILLVFMDTEQDPDWEALLLEWQLLGESDLVTAAPVSETSYQFTACYGAIHRTFDYPEDGDLFSDYDQGYRLPVIEGTKIGGIPRWIQDEQEVPPGRFIAAVGSIQPAYDAAYPWLNVPAPIETFQELYGEEQLMWGGDMGSLYLFLDDQGQVHATVQDY